MVNKSKKSITYSEGYGLIILQIMYRSLLINYYLPMQCENSIDNQ
jgi:hypothetical protein